MKAYRCKLFLYGVFIQSVFSASPPDDERPHEEILRSVSLTQRLLTAARQDDPRVVHLSLAHLSRPTGPDFDRAGYHLAVRHPAMIQSWLALGPSRAGIGRALLGASEGHNTALVRQLLNHCPTDTGLDEAGYGIVESHPDLIETWLSLNPSPRGIAHALIGASESRKSDLVQRFLDLASPCDVFGNAGGCLARYQPEFLEIWISKNSSKLGMARALYGLVECSNNVSLAENLISHLRDEHNFNDILVASYRLARGARMQNTAMQTVLYESMPPIIQENIRTEQGLPGVAYEDMEADQQRAQAGMAFQVHRAIRDNMVTLESGEHVPLTRAIITYLKAHARTQQRTDEHIVLSDVARTIQRWVSEHQPHALACALAQEDSLYMSVMHVLRHVDRQRFVSAYNFAVDKGNVDIYMNGFFRESIEAYDGDNPISCVDGTRERVLLGLRRVDAPDSNLERYFQQAHENIYWMDQYQMEAENPRKNLVLALKAQGVQFENTSSIVPIVEGAIAHAHHAVQQHPLWQKRSNLVYVENSIRSNAYLLIREMIRQQPEEERLWSTMHDAKLFMDCMSHFRNPMEEIDVSCEKMMIDHAMGKYIKGSGDQITFQVGGYLRLALLKHPHDVAQAAKTYAELQFEGMAARSIGFLGEIGRKIRAVTALATDDFSPDFLENIRKYLR